MGWCSSSIEADENKNLGVLPQHRSSSMLLCSATVYHYATTSTMVTPPPCYILTTVQCSRPTSYYPPLHCTTPPKLTSSTCLQLPPMDSTRPYLYYIHLGREHWFAHISKDTYTKDTYTNYMSNCVNCTLLCVWYITLYRQFGVFCFARSYISNSPSTPPVLCPRSS